MRIKNKQGLMRRSLFWDSLFKRGFVIAAFVLLVVFTVFVAGCAPKMHCEAPAKVIGDSCCLDGNDNGVCDSYEPAPAKTPVVSDSASEQAVDQGSEDKVPEESLGSDVSQNSGADTASVKAPAEDSLTDKNADSESELKAGVFKIKFGEPKKYVDVLKLDAHRYSADKVMLDDIWYVVRNVGDKTLNPEVRIRAEGVRVNDYEDSYSSKEFTYDLDPLEPGEKEIINLLTDLRYSQMNKTRTLTISVYERFVAPKEELGETVYEFRPVDELESMDISWVPKD